MSIRLANMGPYGETQENLGRINLVHKNPIVELADRFIFFAYFDNFEIIFSFFNAYS